MSDYSKKHPNIIFILCDDQGEWAMGSSDNDQIITPNLDRLADEGIRFTNFFCASPVCSPARASILTGMIPSQHGVHDWISGSNTKRIRIKVNLFLILMVLMHMWKNSQRKAITAVLTANGIWVRASTRSTDFIIGM